MSIWFIIAWIGLGIIAMGIVGYAFISGVAERHVGADWKQKMFADEPEQTEGDEVKKNEVDQVMDEYMDDAKEYRKTLPKFNLICWILFTIVVWPFSTPYLLSHINKYGDAIEDYIHMFHKDE